MSRARSNTANDATGRTVYVVVGAYLAIGILWVVGADSIARLLVSWPEAQAVWRHGNPWVFVALSTVILFVLVTWADTRRTHPGSDYWRSVIEHAEEGFWLIDHDARILHVNQVLGEMLGYPPAEMYGRTPFEFADDAGRAVLEAQVGADGRPGHRHRRDGPRRYEVTLSTRRGDTLFTLFHATSLWDDHGNLTGSYAFVTDLTEIRRQERELELTRHALEHSFDTILRVAPAGRILDVNRTACTQLGYTRSELLELSIPDIDPNFPSSVWPDHWQELKRRKYMRFETSHQRKDGTTFPVEVGLAYLEFDGQEHSFAVARDITDYQRQLAELRRAATVFHHSAEGIVVTDPERRILLVNDAFTTITGYTEAEAQGNTPAILHSGLQSAAFYESMWNELDRHGVWQGEIWNRRKNGEIYPELLTISEVRDDAGELVNYVGVFADLTQAHQAREEIAFRDYHDLLTRLPNRALFRERLDHALGLLTRRERHLGVVMLDLAGFGALNDSLGSEAGDGVLVEMAKRLQAATRTGDTVARPGGDEFWVLLEDLAHREDVQQVVHKILGALGEPVTIDDQTIRLKAQVGIAVAPDDGADSNQLLTGAATALHRAQRNEAEEIQYFRSEMHEEVRRRVRLEEALKVAIDEGQLRVWYQPQVELATGTALAVEALVRWEHPDWGLISPANFIPLAEETGLVVPLGNWVLEEALRHYGEWLSNGESLRHVAVNVGAAQLRSPDFYDAVAGALQRTGVPGNCLELEITEQGFLGDVAAAVETLNRLSELGTRLAIDDFGTGYCSLAYLKELPLDTLKIDKTFIDGIPDSEYDRSIVEAMLAVAGALNLDVVAEGVEHESQLEWLRARGVSCGQGFVYARPQPIADLSAWLKSSRGQVVSE